MCLITRIYPVDSPEQVEPKDPGNPTDYFIGKAI